MLVRKKRRSPSKRGSSAWITRITVMDEGFKEAGEEALTKGDEKKKKMEKKRRKRCNHPPQGAA